MAITINRNILWAIIIVLIILNLVSLGALWLTREPNTELPFRRIRGPERGSRFLKKELRFNPRQESQFDSLMHLHRSNLESKIEEIRTLRGELMSMMRKQEFTGEAEEMVREIGKKQAELELMNFRHFRNVMEICDEQQKKIFLKTLRNAVGPRHPGGERGPHGPGWRRGR